MNTGGPAFPVPDTYHPNGQVQFGSNGMTLLDWYAGQALAGFFGFISETQATMKDAGLPGIKREQVSRECYEQAESMLAEKARREAVVQESSTTESYITDKNGIPVARVTHAPISDHSPDATKMIELQAANRELVEALENVLATQIDPNGSKACKDARAIIAKHKGAA